MRSVADADTYNFKGLNYCNYYTMNQYLLLSTIATRETRRKSRGVVECNQVLKYTRVDSVSIMSCCPCNFQVM